MLLAFDHRPAYSGLAITLAVDDDTPVVSEDTITFTSKVTNSGPAASGAVTVSFSWQGGETGISTITATPQVGSYGSTKAINGTWTIPNILAGGNVTITVTATAETTDPKDAVGTISGFTNIDLNAANDSATVTITAEDSGLDPEDLGTIFTSGYYHAQYSDPPKNQSQGTDVETWVDLSAATNDLTATSKAPKFDIDTGVNSVDLWDTSTAFLEFTDPLSFAGAFTLIWLVDGHTGGSDTHICAGDGVDNALYHFTNDTITFSTSEGSAQAAADIPNSASKVLLAMWRTSGNAVNFAATGLTTVSMGTASGTSVLNFVGGDSANVIYETRKVIAIGAVDADVSAQLPAIAAALGTTLTL